MQSVFHTISDKLVQDGYIILEDILDKTLTQALYKRIQSLKSTDLSEASIGRGSQHHNNSNIRSDKTIWLDGDEENEKAYLLWMDNLKQELNQALYLGLHDYETHFAHFAQGTFYQKHFDVLHGNNKRLLTTVFYLTKDWKDGDGGELLIYNKDGNRIIQTVAPKMGTMVIFLSDKFPHEVLASKKDRYSIAGWFRGRS